MTLSEILQEVSQYQPHYITVTGGEPLAQKDCAVLLEKLCEEGYDVSLETSGALDVSTVDSRVIKVMDLKTPSSGELAKNLQTNIQYLTQQDQVKFVIADREDYDWSMKKLEEFDLTTRCEVLFSPVHNALAPRQLAEWILEDRLQVRMQVQLHKFLWGEEPGH